MPFVLPVIIGLLLGYGSSLVDSNLCPENCLKGSCCEVDIGDFRCCPYDNGVCCRDGKSCCPEGSRCNPKTDQCIFVDGSSSPAKQLSEKLNKTKQKSSYTAPLKISSENVICPDRQSVCTDNTTCCPMSHEKWGCCPHLNAVCCSDGQHCCPHGSVCDPTHHLCTPSSYPHKLSKMNDFFQNIHLMPTWSSARINPSKIIGKKLANQLEAKYFMAYSGTLCPDPYFECPSNTTCCQSMEEGWACCPLTDAVCCDDGKHCCPNGYKCDLGAERCIQISSNELMKPPAPTSILSQSKKISKNIICPDSDVMCPSDSTCCKVPEGGWGCCPFPQAVCCSDGTHCCPANTTCNIEAEACMNASGAIISSIQSKFVPKFDNNLTNLPVNICRDNKSACVGGTCCPGLAGSSDQLSLCCPHENAVCCGDGKHCCPKGTVCDMINGGCIPQEDSSKPQSLLLFKKIAAVKTDSKDGVDEHSDVFTQLCSGGKFKCPETSTCCKLSNGEYACCPVRNATCCTDGLHCCPSGTTCDYKKFSCIQLDNTTNNNNKNGKTAGELLRKHELQSIVEILGHHVCPDHQSMCPDDNTCCQLLDKSWGCCPLKDGICCADRYHCCPNGSVCNLETKQCISPTDVNLPHTQVDDNHDEKVDFKKASWCGACGDSWACCPDDTLNSWYCCPYIGGVCCADKILVVHQDLDV
ncbi:unnamed protein product [Heterobilharzia americana]|nr:unnamed protein product [Heterobilharzia americana]